MNKPMAILFILMVLQSVTGSSGGINQNIDIQGTGIASLEYEDFVIESNDFDITVILDNETAKNGTSVTIVTQICINSGVCYPPEDNDLISSEDRKFWNGSIEVNEDASYLNWRIKMIFSDGNETNIPENGFGWKVWSTCWFDGVSWGGSDESCNSSVEDSSLSGFGILITISAAFIAVVVTRHRRGL